MALNPLPIEPCPNWLVDTAPALAPITVADVKLYGRIDGTAEDALITQFIEGVTENAEAWLGRALISQTLIASFDDWPASPIDLPQAAPLISISEVRTLDEDDTATVYDSDNYYTDTYREPGTLILTTDATPPQNVDRYFGGYEIEYVCGYGTAATDVPYTIRLGLMLWTVLAYETRTVMKEPPPEAIKAGFGFYKVGSTFL